MIPKVVRARNELTHAGALESSAEEELHELFHLMIMLMNTTLLRELGYDPLDTEDQLWHTPNALAVDPTRRLPMGDD